MRRSFLIAAVFFSLLLFPMQAQSQPVPNPGCSPNGDRAPQGQSPSTGDPMLPIWCYPLTQGPTTARIGPNSWSDTFPDSDMIRLEDRDLGYRVFTATSSGRVKAQAFVNENYWQVDLVDTSQFLLMGGLLLSPDKTFQFENGRLVVEFDANPGNWNTGGADVFYEIDVTSAAAPTGWVVDNSYGYGMFGGTGAIGCRLQRLSEGGSTNGATVCAMYDDSYRDADGFDVRLGRKDPANPKPGRLWETQGALNDITAATNIQHNPAGHWRQCAEGQADELCRDTFRLELTKTDLLLYVNGFLQREIRGLYASNPSSDLRYTGRDNRVPDSWLTGGVRIYLTSWINNGQHDVQRFKWGDIRVNATSASPGTPTPTATATSTPATTATGTPQATSTVTSLPTSTATATPTPGPISRICTLTIAVDGTVSGFCPPAVP